MKSRIWWNQTGMRAVKGPMSAFRLVTLALLIGSASAFAVEPSPTAPAGFVLTLSVQEQLEAGLGKLSAEQQVVLNTLVAREVAIARENGLNGFAGSFSSRRSTDERTRIGLDRLTAAEEEKLNALVAQALAARVAMPKSRPRLRDSDINGAHRKREVHGSVSVGYGWGRGGREFRTGSVYVHTYDPETGIGIGVGVATTEGDSWWGWPGYYDSFWDYPYAYSYRYPYAYGYPVIVHRAGGSGHRGGRGRF